MWLQQGKDRSGGYDLAQCSPPNPPPVDDPLVAYQVKHNLLVSQAVALNPYPNHSNQSKPPRERSAISKTHQTSYSERGTKSVGCNISVYALDPSFRRGFLKTRPVMPKIKQIPTPVKASQYPIRQTRLKINPGYNSLSDKAVVMKQGAACMG